MARPPHLDPDHPPATDLGTPDDVTKAAMFLLSEASAGYVTAVDLPVDGGLVLHRWRSFREPAFS